MLRRTLSLAAAVLACAASAPGQVRPANAAPEQASSGSPRVWVEPGTEVAFPVRSWLHRGRPPQHLAGVAVHTRTLFNVKSLVMGFYVDGRAAAGRLSEWKGKPASKIQSDRKFYEALLDADFDKSLRLVMVRESPAGEFAGELEGPLTEMLRLVGRRIEDPGAAKALEVFLLTLRTRGFPESAELVLAWRAGGSLVVLIQGQAEPAIQSPALCRALFELHLGDHAFSRKARKSLVLRFPEILAADHPADSDALQGALESLGSGG